MDKGRVQPIPPLHTTKEEYEWGVNSCLNAAIIAGTDRDNVRKKSDA